MIKNDISYKNDVFFKFCMAGEDEKSIFIRHSILESLLGFHILKTTVLNPEILPNSILEKRVILDILLKDDKGQFFNIEMQISGYSKNNLLRFQEYAFRMASRQTEKGKDYTQLKTCYQIIFIDDISTESDEFIRYFTFKDQHALVYDAGSLINTVFVQMPVINRIAEKKGVDNLNAFEQLCYLFKNGADDDILKSKERLVESIMEKHEEIKDNNEWWTWADAIERGERSYEGNLKEKFEDGFKEGIEQGRVEGIELGIEQGTEKGIELGIEQGRIKESSKTLQILHNTIKLKYKIEDDGWLHSLDRSLLTDTLALISLCESYEDLQQKVSLL